MIAGHGPLESDTCREYVLPALKAAGWRSEQIVEQRYFTDGRIIARARGHRRGEGKRSDYLLDIGLGHLDDFVDPETRTPVILTTSRLLTTGIDAPMCRNIVLFRPVGSMVEFKQIIGRGTRLYPDLDKLSFQIIDYTGATELFSDPEFDGRPETIEHIAIDGDGQVVAFTVIPEAGPVPRSTRSRSTSTESTWNGGVRGNCTSTTPRSSSPANPCSYPTGKLGDCGWWSTATSQRRRSDHCSFMRMTCGRGGGRRRAVTPSVRSSCNAGSALRRSRPYWGRPTSTPSTCWSMSRGTGRLQAGAIERTA